MTGVCLKPPNFWDADQSTPKHTVETLAEFCYDCDYLSRSCNIFAEILKGHRTDATEVASYKRPMTHPAEHKGRLRRRVN